MKHFLNAFILLFALASFGQATVIRQNPKAVAPGPSDNSQVYALSGLEIKPEFPGGLAEFYKYIAANFVLPAHAGLNGNILATFVIDTDGTVGEVKILRDIGFGTGEEALRVLSNSPKWIPGRQNGQSVRVQYALPIKVKT